MFSVSPVSFFIHLCFISQALSILPDYEYFSEVGYLKLHDVKATWHDARLRCHYEGGVLASPVNKSLAAAMRALMTRKDSKLQVHEVFTGIHCQFSFGDFTSVEGIPLDAMDLHWAPESRGYSEQECILMRSYGHIEEADCNSKHPYICYIDAPQNESVTACGTRDKEYVLDPRTGSCYKVHGVGRTWSRAFMTCQAEGGHLAIINSDLEAEVIKDLLSKHPPATMFADYTHVASIGYADWGERGNWWTIHGQELSEAGYDKWQEKTPDGTGSQFCGGVNRTGKLNDIWCRNQTFPLICEIPANALLDVRLSLANNPQ